MMKGELISSPNDNKTLGAIRWLNSLSRSYIWWAVGISSLVIFIVCSLIGKMSIFSAFGAFVVCLGLFITAGVTIPVELDEVQEKLDAKLGTSSIASLKEGEEILKKINGALHLTLKEREKQVTGLEISILGTVMWGVGGFIPPYLKILISHT